MNVILLQLALFPFSLRYGMPSVAKKQFTLRSNIVLGQQTLILGSPRVSSTPSGLVSVTFMILWVFGGEKTIWSTNEPLWKRFWGCLTKGSKIDFQFNFSMDCFPLQGFGVQGSWNYGVGSYLGPIIRVGVPWGTLPRVPKFISNLILHWNYSCRSLAMGGSWN